MTIVATPPTFSVIDSVPFTLTVLLTDDLSGSGDDPLFVPNAVLITGAVSSDSGVSVSFTGNTFVATGKSTQTLSKTINYIDSNNVKKAASSFADLTPDYKAVFSFAPPTVSSKDMTITVSLSDSSTFVYPISVGLSITATMNSFAASISGGTR